MELVGQLRLVKVCHLEFQIGKSPIPSRIRESETFLDGCLLDGNSNGVLEREERIRCSFLQFDMNEVL